MMQNAVDIIADPIYSSYVIRIRNDTPLQFVFLGDFVYSLGQLTGESITSTAGALIVIASTLVSLWLRFKKEDRELQRDQEVKDREARRLQDEKDLHLKDKIEEARKLIRRIDDLETQIESLTNENETLRAKTNSFGKPFQNPSGSSFDEHPKSNF